jgi:Raf kinase inhibitor-like YbhB/YbcL family protein
VGADSAGQAVSGMRPAPTQRNADDEEAVAMGLNIQDLTVTSPSFKFGQAMPAKHAYDGDNVSPEIAWSGTPEGTGELAVVCHDPDAPLPWGFTHWLVYGIPPQTTRLAEGDGSHFSLGLTTFGSTGYGGPAPPPGHGPHNYYFWVYCLDQPLNAPSGLDRLQLLERMSGHVIEQNRLVGVYER